MAIFWIILSTVKSEVNANIYCLYTTAGTGNDAVTTCDTACGLTVGAMKGANVVTSLSEDDMDGWSATQTVYINNYASTAIAIHSLALPTGVNIVVCAGNTATIDMTDTDLTTTHIIKNLGTLTLTNVDSIDYAAANNKFTLSYTPEGGSAVSLTVENAGEAAKLDIGYTGASSSLAMSTTAYKIDATENRYVQISNTGTLTVTAVGEIELTAKNQFALSITTGSGASIATSTLLVKNDAASSILKITYTGDSSSIDLSTQIVKTGSDSPTQYVEITNNGILDVIQVDSITLGGNDIYTLQKGTTTASVIIVKNTGSNPNLNIGYNGESCSLAIAHDISKPLTIYNSNKLTVTGIDGIGLLNDDIFVLSKSTDAELTIFNVGGQELTIETGDDGEADLNGKNVNKKVTLKFTTHALELGGVKNIASTKVNGELILEGTGTKTIECAAGYSGANCAACTGNTYSAAAGTTGTCDKCAPGFFGATSASCSQCDEATYSSIDTNTDTGVTKTVCTKCPPGYGKATAAAACTECASTAHTTSLGDSTECDKCVAGYYWDSTATECKECPGNTYSQINHGSAEEACIYCKSAFGIKAGEVKCTACPTGYTSDGNGVTCVKKGSGDNESEKEAKTSKKKGLSGGAIAGIVIACVVVVAGAAVGIIFFLKKKKTGVVAA